MSDLISRRKEEWKAIMMERLTKRNSDGTVGISELRYYNYDDFQKMAQKLAEYEDLEEQGLLLRLACKIGSPLYRVYKKPTKCTAYGEYKDDYSYSCEGCEQECDSSYVWSIYKYEADIKTIVCLSNEIGKTVFLTKEEAENKLKEMESDNNGTME